MTNIVKPKIGAALLASSSTFFVGYAALDRAPEDQRVWFILTAVTLAISGASLYPSRATRLVAVFYAAILAFMLFVIGMTHPTLERFLICTAFDVALVAAAVLLLSSN
jgi:hypothetical protein